MLRGRVGYKWGDGVQDVFLNIKTKKIYYSFLGIPEEYDPHNTYVSCSGMTGEGHAYFPEHVIKVNTFTPGAKTIQRVTKAIELGGKIYASIYVPILWNGIYDTDETDETVQPNDPYVLVIQEGHFAYSENDYRRCSHIIVTSHNLDDIFTAFGTAVQYAISWTTKNFYEYVKETGVGVERYLKYNLSAENPDGEKWYYIHIGDQKEEYWFLERFLDTRWQRKNMVFISEIHSMFGIEKVFTYSEEKRYIWFKDYGTKHVREGKYLGSEDPLFIPEQMEKIGAETLRATQKTVVYMYKDRVIGLIKSAIGIFEYEVEYPSKNIVRFAPDVFIAKVINGCKDKLKRTIEYKKKIADEEKALISLSDDIIITFTDSLESGNCRYGTEEFRKQYFPDKEYVTVGELKKYIGNSNVRRVLLYVASKNTKKTA